MEEIKKKKKITGCDLLNTSEPAEVVASLCYKHSLGSPWPSKATVWSKRKQECSECNGDLQAWV